MSVSAVRNDRAPRLNLFLPLLDILGRSVDRADDQPIVGVERYPTPNVKQQRCRGRAQAPIQVMPGN